MSFAHKVLDSIQEVVDRWQLDVVSEVALLPLPRFVDERLVYDIDHLLSRLLVLRPHHVARHVHIILRDRAGRRGHLQVSPDIVALYWRRLGLLSNLRHHLLAEMWPLSTVLPLLMVHHGLLPLMLVVALTYRLYTAQRDSVVRLLIIGRTYVGVLFALLSRPLPGLIPRLVALITLIIAVIISLVPVVIVPSLLGRTVPTSALIAVVPPPIVILVLGASEAFAPPLPSVVSLRPITDGVWVLSHL